MKYLKMSEYRKTFELKNTYTLAIAMLRLVMKSSIMSALMLEFSFGNKLETSFAKGA